MKFWRELMRTTPRNCWIYTMCALSAAPFRALFAYWIQYTKPGRLDTESTERTYGVHRRLSATRGINSRCYDTTCWIPFNKLEKAPKESFFFVEVRMDGCYDQSQSSTISKEPEAWDYPGNNDTRRTREVLSGPILLESSVRLKSPFPEGDKM